MFTAIYERFSLIGVSIECRRLIEETGKVRVLALSADDHLTKPFGIGEFLARFRVALRSSSRIQGVEGPAGTSPQFGEVEINLLSHQVAVRGFEVDLTTHEFKILRTPVQNAGKVPDSV